MHNTQAILNTNLNRLGRTLVVFIQRLLEIMEDGMALYSLPVFTL
jgi:DNA invertase Pin-like site-specific DNA recombinase